MLFDKYAEDVNEAFRRSSMLIKLFKDDCEKDNLQFNLGIIFAECVFALYESGYSREHILQRLIVELDIYEKKQSQRRHK